LDPAARSLADKDADTVSFCPALQPWGDVYGVPHGRVGTAHARVHVAHAHHARIHADADGGEVLVDVVAQGFGAQAFANAGEAADIGEQNRELGALRLVVAFGIGHVCVKNDEKRDREAERDPRT